MPNKMEREDTIGRRDLDANLFEILITQLVHPIRFAAMLSGAIFLYLISIFFNLINSSANDSALNLFVINVAVSLLN